MAHSGGEITAPISIVDDIAAVLGETTGDLGTLCKSSAINVWSKYKPIRYESPEIPSATRQSIYESLNYGLKVPTSYAYPNLAASNKWTYNRPRGSGGTALAPYTEWYRAADFENYFHYGSDPIYTLGDIDYNRFFEPDDGIALSEADIVSTSNILYSDLEALYDKYTCVAFEFEGSYWYRSSANTIGSGVGGSLFRIKPTDLTTMGATSTGDEVTYYIMAVDTPSTTLASTGDNGERYISLPYFEHESMSGTITISNDNPLRFTCEGVMAVAEVSSSARFLDPDPYLRVIPVGQDWDFYYLMVSPYYSMSIQFTVTNSSSADVTLYASQFKVLLEENFVSGVSDLYLQYIGNDNTTGLYEYVSSAWAEVTDVTIPANGSANIAVSLPESMFIMNQMGTPQTSPTVTGRITALVELYYKNSYTSIYTDSWRFRNQ